MTEPAGWTFDAIGTRWRIDSRLPIPGAVRLRVTRRIDDYDQAFSRFRADSLVRRHAEVGGALRYPDEVVPLLALYARLERLTGGRVSPLVGETLERVGYDAAYSLRPSGAPSPAPAMAELLTVEGPVVTLQRPTVLDVGAAGKGQLVDLVADLLGEEGVAEVTVDAGGDLRHDGTTPLRVALEHPYDPTSAIGVVELGPGRPAIAGSAGNRRAWGDGWHHILDGSTGLPVRSVVATWALASTAMTADALATALFFVRGEAVADAFDDVDWVRVLADGRIERSSGLPGEVFAG